MDCTGTCSGIAEGTTIDPPPTDWSITKKTKYYLDEMSFDVGTIDDDFNVKTSSALIMLQYYKGISNVTGNINDTSYNLVINAANDGITYDSVDTYAASHPAGSSSISKETSTNGYQVTSTMVSIPGGAIVERNTAIAWAILVNAARKAGYGVDVFSAQNENSGYRSYHYQVEAYVKERKVVDADNASNPYFTKGTTLQYVIDHELRSTNSDANNPYAEAWIDNCQYDASLGWNNVPDSATAESGDLFGYGGSNHGWGLAIDMNIHASDGGVYTWLTSNCGTYGFDAEPGEEWHWNYIR